MFNRKGEISTILILGTLAVIGVATLFGATVNNERNTTNTRAEFDGTFCNDNIGDTLNKNGTTAFNINCWGNLNRAYTYALFWCPNQSKGAAYCGDIRDIEGSKAQAQVLEQSQGAVLPSDINKSTDKTCGCVSWQVGVQNAAGEKGWAGGVNICSDNACTENQPTNLPTNSPVQTTPKNTPTLNPTSKLTATTTPTPTIKKCSGNLSLCPGTNLCVPSLVECEPTTIPSRIPTPTVRSCSGNLINCPGTDLCVSALVECEPTPTLTPVRVKSPTPTASNTINIPLVGSISEPTPVPAPTITKTEQIETQQDVIFVSCFDKNGQITWESLQNCAVENADEGTKLLNQLNEYFESLKQAK